MDGSSNHKHRFCASWENYERALKRRDTVKCADCDFEIPSKPTSGLFVGLPSLFIAVILYQCLPVWLVILLAVPLYFGEEYVRLCLKIKKLNGKANI